MQLLLDDSNYRTLIGECQRKAQQATPLIVAPLWSLWSAPFAGKGRDDTRPNLQRTCPRTEIRLTPRVFTTIIALMAVFQASARFKATPWGIRDVIFAILVAAGGLIVLNVISFALNQALHGALRDNRDALSIFVVAQDVIFLSAVWLFSVVRYRVGWDRLGLRGYAVLLGCALSAMLLIASYVVRFFYVIVAFALGFRIAPQQVLTRLDLTGVGFLLTLFVGAVAAPFTEEIFFRGFVYGGLRGRIGVVGAMIVSAAFFTALHFTLELFLPIFILGLFLTWLYEYTGSLYPGMFLHAANNAVALILVALLQTRGLMPT